MKGRLTSAVHAIAARANLAPAVHNTQPITWHADGDTLWLLADRARFLQAADPKERDAGYSAGTALEGTLLALSAMQLSVRTLEELHGVDIESPV